MPAAGALLAVATASASAAVAKDITLPPSGDNQFSSVTHGIGLVRVTIEDSSPDVHAPDGKDRAGHIWGELVPYGLHDLAYNNCKSCPWRGGALLSFVELVILVDVEVAHFLVLGHAGGEWMQ